MRPRHGLQHGAIVPPGLLRDHAVTTARTHYARPTGGHPRGVSYLLPRPLAGPRRWPPAPVWRRPDRAGVIALQLFAAPRRCDRADARGRGRRDRLDLGARSSYARRWSAEDDARPRAIHLRRTSGRWSPRRRARRSRPAGCGQARPRGQRGFLPMPMSHEAPRRRPVCICAPAELRARAVADALEPARRVGARVVRARSPARRPESPPEARHPVAPTTRWLAGGG